MFVDDTGPASTPFSKQDWQADHPTAKHSMRKHLEATPTRGGGGVEA